MKKISLLLASLGLLLASCATNVNGGGRGFNSQSEETSNNSSESGQTSADSGASDASEITSEDSAGGSSQEEVSEYSSIEPDDEEYVPPSDADEDFDAGDYMDGPKKNVKGAGLLFEEAYGFYDKDACVFEENGHRYVIYATTRTSKGGPVFAAREATKDSNNNWVYGEKKIILKGAYGDWWDAYIFSPSVIKGSFSYNNVTYSYLMAYQGSYDGDDINNQIGLAVSNNILGVWKRVGEFPLIPYEREFDGTYGVGSPCLVSIDHQSKGYLFYSFGETELSGERVKAFDFSDLNHIVLEEGYAELPIDGIDTSTNRPDRIISNAGFAVDSSSNLYMVLDGTAGASAPNRSLSFEVTKSTLSCITDYSGKWDWTPSNPNDAARVFSFFETSDEEHMDGWDQLCSGDFVTDEYGSVKIVNNKVEVVFTGYDTDVVGPQYTAQLASVFVEVGV